MNLNTRLNCKDEEVKAEKCIVEKTIELDDDEYESLCEDLMAYRGFITENKESMYVDTDGVAHCILALGENYDDGILINSEGYDYARYYSVIPNARQLVVLDRYPSMRNFMKRMSSVVEDILSKAVAESNEDNREYTVDIEKYNKAGEPVVNPALLDDMLTDSGMVEDTILHDDSIELCLTEQAADTQYRECYDANCTTELEIICAKHALWLYDEVGGERADFSNCLLKNVDLSNRNLCGAVFNDAAFINCNLDDASMCGASFENTKFNRCIMKHLTAEEADFKDSDFYNCDLKGAYFTHSTFTKAKLADCNFHETSFTKCCIESWNFTNCNLKIADLSNVSYFESDWLSEHSEDESSVQSM